MDESFLKNLNILYVEDENDIIALIEKRLASKFKSFTSVNTAEEAIELFKENHYDLVLTDYILPKMNGMEFAKEILSIKSKVPVILITGYVDMQFLVEAINMGITQFVSKPIQFKLLRNAINNAVESVVLEHVLNKNREQELELLKYKDMYNNMQHDATLRKELHLMRNDMFKKYIYKGDNPISDAGWQFEVFYKSLDIVSGDTYTCRLLENGNVIIFIADAMGKGISASITSLVSVALTNYIILEEQTYHGKIDIQDIIGKCTAFMSDNLLEDEVLCASFIYLDFINDKMQYASFAMPRIIYETKEGKIEKLPSNNLPIMPYNHDVFVKDVELSNIQKLAIFTDGVVETETEEKEMYSAYLNDDFHRSPFSKNLMEHITEKIPSFDDDTTIFFIRRPFGSVIREKSFSIPTEFYKLDSASDVIRKELQAEGIDPDNYDAFFAAFSECVMNAYEHGNLAISTDVKHDLIKNGDYEEQLLALEKECDKQIIIHFAICQESKSRYMIASVRDEGLGYPKKVFKNAIGDPTKFNGRGIKIIDYYTDIFFFSEDRKEIFIGKEITD